MFKIVALISAAFGSVFFGIVMFIDSDLFGLWFIAVGIASLYIVIKEAIEQSKEEKKVKKHGK